MLSVGVDIGGTGAKLGLVNAAGEIVARGAFPTGRSMGGDELVAKLTTWIVQSTKNRETRGIGVAAPGMRRADGEGVINVTNLPLLDGYPLRSSIARSTGLPTVLDNDANAAAMGEFQFGGGTDADRLLVLTLGTGIGAGMVVGGEVHRVAWQGLGDPGHVIVQRGGPECGCGGHGCVEAIASVPALLRTARVNGLECESFSILVENAVLGNSTAKAALAEGGAWIGMALATLVHLLGPDLVLLGGGGLDAAGAWLMNPIRATFSAHVQPFLAEKLTIGRAQLGNDAGLVGAAALVST